MQNVWLITHTFMSYLKKQDQEIFDAIQNETKRQQEGMELIASENYASAAVMEAMGSVFTNKYSEGYPRKRYYGGQEFVDTVEELAIDRAKQLFAAEHVNVQCYSGSPANLAVYLALLQPGDKVMGLSLAHGGHLTHGHPLSFSGKLYNVVAYEVEKDTERIDMDKVREIALREKPKMLIAGFSAYSRDMDWRGFKEIADEVGAITFADIAHIAGLIAGKQLENPVPIFDVVSTTTHKTLRGPRGAMLMCKQEFAQAIDKAVFPGVQGGPHDHITAAKAVAFREALQPEFAAYAKQVIANAQALAASLAKNAFRIISGGTDNHLMLIDLTSKGLTGKEAETALETCGITVNKNMIPFDERKPLDPSGIRLGTPAITTRGMKEKEMELIAGWINRALENHTHEAALAHIRAEVKEFCLRFPIPTPKNNIENGE